MKKPREARKRIDTQRFAPQAPKRSQQPRLPQSPANRNTPNISPKFYAAWWCPFLSPRGCTSVQGTPEEKKYTATLSLLDQLPSALEVWALGGWGTESEGARRVEDTRTKAPSPAHLPVSLHTGPSGGRRRHPVGLGNVRTQPPSSCQYGPERT